MVRQNLHLADSLPGILLLIKKEDITWSHKPVIIFFKQLPYFIYFI